MLLEQAVCKADKILNMKRLSSLLLFLLITVCTLLETGCQAKPQRYSAEYYDVFDTVCRFTAYCSSEGDFSAASEAVHRELLRLHRLFDIYDGGEMSVKALNDNGFLDNPDEDILSVLSLGVEYYELSGGRLNIAMGSVLQLWHNARKDKILPDQNELSEAAKHMDISRMELSKDKITLSDPQMSIDLGAIAKGYACEKVTELVLSMGIDNFALDLGRNIRTMGEKPNGKWVIGIQDPDGGILDYLECTDSAVITSGDYERLMELDGKKYSHIIDPDTLYPAEFYRSVTVITDNSSDGDALSTALFCMDLESGRELLEKKGAKAVWVLADGTVVCYEE